MSTFLAIFALVAGGIAVVGLLVLLWDLLMEVIHP